MRKLLEQDKKKRLNIKELEIKSLILKSIFKNLNFFTLTRWNAFLKLRNLSSDYKTKSSLTNKCLYSVNKKRYNKLTNFSRHIFLKLIRSGQISGFKKSTW